MPDLDEVLVDDGLHERTIAAMLRDRKYDTCVITWATARAARIAQLAGIPVRVGQSSRMYSWRFTQRVDVASERGDLTTHWSQILLAYPRAIGCDTANAIPAFVPTREDREHAQRVIAEERVENGFALVHATNAVAAKRRWPAEGWIALTRAAQERYGVPVLLSGTQADAGVLEQIAAAAGARSLAGRVGIGAFGALAQRARFFTGMTTGTMHVAAAVGAPTIGIFPFQTDTPDRWAPLGSCVAVVRASYPCRPGERKETCPDYACVEHLDVARILAAVDSLTSERPLLS